MDDAERIAGDALACALANNRTAPPEGLYCEGTFDTWLCWPHTPAASIAYAQCPDFVPGFSADLLAHKECTENGTWFRHPASLRAWSNYTTCVRPEDDLSDIVALYEAGYALSLAALVLALGVLLRLRALRCARVTLHMNLFAAFAANNALWLAWYALVVRAPRVLAASPAWCRALQAATQYALLTTYCWSLCEGLYLHTVLVRAFVSERRLLRALLLLGWLLPAGPAAVGVARRAAAGERLCWADDASPRLELAIPVVACVLLNACFLVNIVRVLCSKLRAGGLGGGAAGGGPQRALLPALRATCVLAPLLGLQFLLTPARPARGAVGWRAYEALAALVASLQGLLVAVLYCLSTAEVLAHLKRRWRAMTFRPRANSATATTVSFVRSGAPGPGEEKV